jgi:probable rRNA maturation factor
MSSILFYEQKRTSWFRQRNLMRELLKNLFKKERVGFERIQFVFMSDEELLQVNLKFLKHDYYTDIITFDLSSHEADPKTADIYISVDRVEENAIKWNTSKINELRRVMIHGCLHLCGYKDKLKADQLLMRQREEFYLRMYLKGST